MSFLRDLADLLELPIQVRLFKTELEAKLMATKEQVLAAIAAEALQVQEKLSEIQAALDAAIADKQVAVDEVTQTLLQEQSDALGEIITQVGAIVPDTAPVTPPVEPTPGEEVLPSDVL